MYASDGDPERTTASSANDTCAEAASGSVYIATVRMFNALDYFGVPVSF